jgi:hypothetical protein
VHAFSIAAGPVTSASAPAGILRPIFVTTVKILTRDIGSWLAAALAVIIPAAILALGAASAVAILGQMRILTFIKVFIFTDIRFNLIAQTSIVVHWSDRHFVMPL